MSRRRGQRNSPAEKAKKAEENRKRKEAAALAAERAREENERRLAREKEAREAQEAAARQSQLQLETRRKREALVTDQDIVLGSSLVTYGAGLDVHSVITGFDLCRVTIKNLPRNARQEEVVHMFTQQGIERSSFFIGQFKENGMYRETTVLMKAEEGQSIAIGLQGIEFRDHYLDFEVSGDTVGNTVTMESSARNSDCLTVYWRVPSETFIVTYSSTDEARRMISVLDGKIYKGQHIKAQMNQLPPHRLNAFGNNESSIKLTGFPIGTLVDHDLIFFTGSYQIRALASKSCGLQESHVILHRHLQLFPNVKIETFENLTPNPVDGKVRVKVQFETWEDAKRANDSINGKRLHNSPIFRASLPNPLQYTIFIPKQQYEAQKKQWDSLSEKMPDRDAHVQTKIGNRGDVSIQVLGQDKKAVGTLKVRVEHMVAGERLDPEFWHPSFSATNQRVFFNRIYQTKGVFVRADPKTRSLRIYGRSDAMVEEARMMVKEEIDRLAKLETTETLNQVSVGFFVRGGLGKLKELLGEDNATMTFATRVQITVKGGEEGRRHLNRLIAESRTARFVDQTLPGDIEKDICPICTDEISHAEQLGCGHSYCSGCLQHYLESAPHTKSFPLACIGDEGACKVPISIPEIRRFLQPQVFQALVEVAFRSYLDQHAQELKFCTTPDCQQIYRHNPNTRKILQCPSCFSTICSGCDEEAHEGMTCQERRLHKDPAEQDRLFNEWANEHAKPCPECRRRIEKSEGCNHMTCPCGTHFCWQCGKSFSENTIYDHMNTEHNGMYGGRAPVWANPENVGENIFEEQARLLAQVHRHQEIENARVRQQNAMHAQLIEHRRRQTQLEQEALRRQNAQRAQVMEDRRRQFQREQDEIRRQLQNDEDEARRRRETAARATSSTTRDGNWCIIM